MARSGGPQPTIALRCTQCKKITWRTYKGEDGYGRPCGHCGGTLEKIVRKYQMRVSRTRL